MINTAVILAGGLGTRLRSVVQDVPKPMAPIHDRPFLAHQLDYWMNQGIKRFILSVGYMHETIIAYFGDNYRGAAIEYVIEYTPMGTGGGLVLVMQQCALDKPFLLLNGDTYFAVDLKQLEQFAVTREADWVFSLFRTDNSERYMGLDVAPDGRIRTLQPSLSPLSSRLANGGVYWVNPKTITEHLMAYQNDPVSLEQDVFPALLAQGARFFGMECSGSFIDIGLPEDYYRSEQVLARN